MVHLSLVVYLDPLIRALVGEPPPLKALVAGAISAARVRFRTSIDSDPNPDHNPWTLLASSVA